MAEGGNPMEIFIYLLQLMGLGIFYFAGKEDVQKNKISVWQVAAISILSLITAAIQLPFIFLLSEALILALLWLMAYIYPNKQENVGYGDYVMFLAGMGFLPSVLWMFVFTLCFVGCIYYFLKKTNAATTTRLPMVPFMTVAFGLTIFAAQAAGVIGAWL